MTDAAYPTAAPLLAAPQVAGVAPARPGAKLLARWTVALTAFLGAFVINEPAPYELFLLLIMVLLLFLAFSTKVMDDVRMTITCSPIRDD